MRRKKTRNKKMSIRDKVRENAKKAAENRTVGTVRLPDGVEWWKEEKGKFLIDILPYEVKTEHHPDGVEPGELWYKLPYKVHFGIGLEQKSYVCPTTFGKRCPICEHRAKLMKSPDADEELIRALKPRERVLYNVIIRDKKGGKSDIKVWDVSYHNFQRQLDREIIEGEEDWAGFADLEGGYTLRVRFAEEEFGKNTFLRADRIDFIEREDYDESILDKVVCLDECLIVLPYEKLEKLFFEVEDEPIADDEEEEQPHVVDEVHEIDLDEEDESEEEEEDEKEETVEQEEPDEQEEKRAKKKTKETKNKCPYGHRFGVDCDEFDDCDECELWDECFEASAGE